MGAIGWTDLVSGVDVDSRLQHLSQKRFQSNVYASGGPDLSQPLSRAAVLTGSDSSLTSLLTDFSAWPQADRDIRTSCFPCFI